MSNVHRILSLGLCLAALSMTACDDSGDDDSGGGDDALTGSDDAGHDDHVDGHHPDGHSDDAEPVPCPPTHVGLKAGLEVTEGDLKLRVISSDPEHARQKMRNDWNVEVLDATGAPVSDATGDGATAFMAVHGHYGLPHPTIVPMQGGRFTVDNLWFNMRGPWEVTVKVKRPSAADTSFQFRVCVE